MRGYLFDSIVHVAVQEAIPEKWRRQWKEATVGRKNMILFEPLVTEILNHLTPKKGEGVAQNRVLWVKGLKTAKMVRIDDKIAFEASRLYLKLKRYGISLVDSFSLSIAGKERARIFTSDFGLRNAAREIGVEVSYLQGQALGQ